MTRSAVYSSFLTATPRIMEPMLLAEITCPEDCIEAVNNILLRRRAHIMEQETVDATPLTMLRIEIPAIESFGFETDIRSYTVG